jgi:hypothetical protein
VAPDDLKPYDFDVALSFAGEDRTYVEEVASALKGASLSVFYDADYLAETWGENLIEFFDGVYRLRSRFAIMFVSKCYAEKMWTRLERRSALTRAMEERGPYVLPVLLDDTQLPGLLPSVGHVDSRRVGIDGLVAAVIKKVAAAQRGVLPGHVDRVPRTDAELAVVLRERPDGWEYLYFAGVLHLELAKHEDRLHDHEMGYAERSGERVTLEEIGPWLSAQTDEASHLARQLEVVLAPQAQERAFGAPGTPGDPARILHLARRSTSIYKNLMDWAAKVRGVSVPDEFRGVIAALAHLVDGPVEQYRRYVKEAVTEIDRVPAALAAGEHLRITLTVEFELRDEDLAAFSAECARVTN